MLLIKATIRLAAVSVALLLAACSGAQVKQNTELDAVLQTGNYSQAALIAEERIGIEPPAPDGMRSAVEYNPKHVLSHLEAAEAWRMDGDRARSIEHYDAAEMALGDVESGVGRRAAGKIGAALVNETLATYVPSPAEAVMINYYKALTFWADGQTDLARVELNRADDRTRRAVERYAKEISEAQAEAARKKSNQTYDNPEVAGHIDSQFPEMSQWQPYAEFVVPPATYLQALFLGVSDVPSDREKSRELFERLGGIVGAHPTLDADLSEIAGGGLCPTHDCIWVLVERGLGPELQERRFTYPVFTDERVVAVQMALPALASRFDPMLASCEVRHGTESAECSPFATMDRVVQTEFSKRFPGIVTRAVVSSVVKGVAQDQAGRQGGLMGMLIATAVTAGITTADVRMWRSLPGDFTIARVKRSDDPNVTIQIAGQAIEVPLSAAGSSLVHVKLPMAFGKPSITTIAF